MLDIGGIGNLKLEYKDHSDVEFLSMEEYWNISKKILNKFGKNIEKTDDVISYVANAIMMGDWRWDKKYKSKNFGRRKDKYSYRNQCGLWAIKTLQTKAGKKKKINIYSLDSKISKSENSFYNFFSTDKDNPCDKAQENEQTELLNQKIKNILSSDTLSSKQKDLIYRYYYKEETLEVIGKVYGLTREAIRQNIVKTIKKIKAEINV